MSAPSPVVVVGRFPPPLDGQTLATARMAELVAEVRPVVGLSTSIPETDLVPTEAQWSWRRVGHYARLRGRLRRLIDELPGAPVLWASISPHPLGHARDVLATLPAFGPTRPVIAVSHRAYFDRMFESPLTRPTAERVVRRSASVVFLTEGLAARAAPWVPDAKRLVIPNTVGTQILCSDAEVDQAVAARAATVHTPRLLFLGGMMSEKGYREALQTLARLPDARLDLAGRWASEADQRQFEAEARALGVVDRTVHHGPVYDRGEVKRLVLGAHLLLFPSTHPSEALPVAVVEALNTGTPTVGVHHGGLPEAVRDRIEGRLVPTSSPHLLADAVVEVLADWRTYAQAARNRFLSAYGPDRIRALWFDALDQAERTR